MLLTEINIRRYKIIIQDTQCTAKPQCSNSGAIPRFLFMFTQELSRTYPLFSFSPMLLWCATSGCKFVYLDPFDISMHGASYLSLNYISPWWMVMLNSQELCGVATFTAPACPCCLMGGIPVLHEGQCKVLTIKRSLYYNISLKDIAEIRYGFSMAAACYVESNLLSGFPFYFPSWHTAFCKRLATHSFACCPSWHSRTACGPMPLWAASCPADRHRRSKVSSCIDVG